MKVSEIVKQLEGLKQNGNLKDQTVEVVMGAKKYFIASSEKDVDRLTFNVTRKNYSAMSNSEFIKKLTEAHIDAACFFKSMDGGDNKEATALHLSPNFLEVNTDE